MCMLIYHPAEAEPFTRSEWDDFFAHNPHGFGVAWRAPAGEVRWRKGLMNEGRSWQLYRTLLNNGCDEMVLHWRFRTAGPIGRENCHPIEATERHLVFHNGARIGPSTSDRSDSVVFAQERLGPALAARPRLADDPAWRTELERSIGAGNRLILWDRMEKKPRIIGEMRGRWWRGRWYSNEYAWTPLPY